MSSKSAKGRASTLLDDAQNHQEPTGGFDDLLAQGLRF
jgi:hypothetical protein